MKLDTDVKARETVNALKMLDLSWEQIQWAKDGIMAEYLREVYQSLFEAIDDLIKEDEFFSKSLTTSLAIRIKEIEGATNAK